MADDYGYAQQATKDAVDTTLQKGADITQALIQQVLQAAHQRQQALNEQQHGSQKMNPQINRNQQIEQFKAFYQAYLEEGVEPTVAQAAAIDAALGLGSSDSRAISVAEEQIMANIAQQQPEPKVLKDRGERDHYPVQSQPTVQAQRFQAIADNYSRGYQANGATPGTAQAAGLEAAVGKGANDSPAIRQAHIEILHHQRLSAMYQGVFEKSGVSLEDAKAAGEQMAKGQGANRSLVVKKAYEQVFGTLGQTSERAQQTTSSPANPQPQNAQPSSSPPDIPTEIWNNYSVKGVAAGVAAHNLRAQQLSDLRTAEAALAAGHFAQDVQQAISRHSPYAQQESVNAQQYAKKVIQQVQPSEKTTTSKKEVHNQHSHSRSPKRKVAKQKPQKAKARDRGRGY